MLLTRYAAAHRAAALKKRCVVIHHLFCHPVALQQGINARRAAFAEGLKFICCAANCRHDLDFVEKARPYFGKLIRSLFKCSISVCAEDFGPFITVVSRCITTSKNMSELVRKTIPVR